MLKGFGVNKSTDMSNINFFNPAIIYYFLRKIKLEYKFRKYKLRVGLKTKVIESKLEDSVILSHSNYIYKCHLGRDVYINNSSFLNNSTIEANTYINGTANISYANIGKFCSIGANVRINLGKHPIDLISTHPAFYSNNKNFKCFSDKNIYKEMGEVHIGNDVWIGDNVTIMGGVNIGHGAIVGTKALVTKDVEPYAIVGGIPAKTIKYRLRADLIKELLEIKWWDLPYDWILENYKLFISPDDFINYFKHKNDNK